MRRLALALALSLLSLVALAQPIVPKVTSVGPTDLVPILPRGQVSPGSVYAPVPLLSTFAPFIGSVVNLDNVVPPPAGDGVTDDTAAVAAALSACATQGGGTVAVGPNRYLIDSASITVPTGCKVSCPTTILGPTNFSTTTFTFVLNSSFTINMGNQSGWESCGVLSKPVSASSAWADYPNLTYRDTANLAAAFAGTAFTVAGDVELRNTFIGGFAVGIGSTLHTARLTLERVFIDSNECIALNDAFDIVRYDTTQCFPFVNSGFAAVHQSFSISNIANNGAGLYRVTLAAPTTIPVTGDTIWVDFGEVGAKSANGKWTATVIDSTHIDLQGSNGTGTATPTGSAASGSPLITGLSTLAGVGVGDGITGTNIPSSTVVKAVSQQTNSLIMSKSTTGAIAGGTLTITDAAYSSGGHLLMDSQQRTGIGMEWTNVTGAVCYDCFVFGHPVGFHIGAGTFGISLTGFTLDSNNALQDPTNLGILVDGNANGAQFAGGIVTTSICEHALMKSTGGGGGNAPHTLSGYVAFNEPQCPVIEIASGNATLVGLSQPINYNRYISIFGAIDGALLDALNGLGANITYENTTAQTNTLVGTVK